ncbi:uncharacterized protein LOC114256474 isoform X3 [Camellia sinensis]|nr:uncharacterized protein LOC114256474 isoform X3 [Camellia sinensis]
MTNVHEGVPTAKDKMVNLKEMCGEQSRSAHQMKGLMSTKMVEGTLVWERVLKMISFINILETLGADVDSETKIDVILSSLPDFYNQFILNYNINKMIVAPSELLNILQVAKDLIKKSQPTVLISEKEGPRKFKPKGKNNFNKKSMGSKFSGKTQGVFKKSIDKKKSKENCFHCGKPGHWKRNCRHYLTTLKKDKPSEGTSNLLVIETNLLIGPPNAWCVDSSATSHICSMLQGFKETRRLKEGKMLIKLGISATVAAVSIGTFYLELSFNRTLVLEDCLFVPNICGNLIFVSKLISLGYCFFFSSKVVIKHNNKFVDSGILIDGLYFISPIDNSINCVRYDTSTSMLPLKRKRDVNQTYMWHSKLGHINLERLNRLVKDGRLDFLKIEPYPIGEPYLQGKMTKIPFLGKGIRATEALELIHRCLWSNKSHGKRWFLPFHYIHR